MPESSSRPGAAFESAKVRPPLPLSAVPKNSLLPLVSKTPPLLPKGASRAEMSVKLPLVQSSPPPSSVICPVPKLLAAEKPMRPPVIVVPPL